MKLADVSAAMDNLLDALNERIGALCEQVGIEPDDPILSDDEDGEEEDNGENGEDGAEDTEGGEEAAGTEGEETAADAEGGAEGTEGAEAAAPSADDGAAPAADDMGADGDTEETNEGTIGSAIGSAVGAVAGSVAGSALGAPALGNIAGGAIGSAIGNKIGDAVGGDDKETDECMQSVDEEVPAQSRDTGADGVAIGEPTDDPNQPPMVEEGTDDIVSQLENNVAAEDDGAVVANEDARWDGDVRDEKGRKTGVHMSDYDGRVNPDKIYKPGCGMEERSFNAQQRLRQNKQSNQDAARDAIADGKILSECGDPVDEGCCGGKKCSKTKDFSDFKKWTGGKKGAKKVDEAADGKFVLKADKGYFMAGGNQLEDEFYTDDKSKARAFDSEKDAKEFADNFGDGDGPKVEFSVEKM